MTVSNTGKIQISHTAAPIAYRLIRRGDGNGNMVPVLQALFPWSKGAENGREWRDLQTQDEPYVEDHIPFSFV
jgi:hypothetical protein